jgi:hypothetical protein
LTLKLSRCREGWDLAVIAAVMQGGDDAVGDGW